MDGQIRKPNSSDKLKCGIFPGMIVMLDTRVLPLTYLLTSNAYALPMPSDEPVTTKR